ncbi:lysophospholipase [Gordonibacter massiliensis (ex Traore et al. 2017)]|nr:lysophospholipase [Gordonibacter massiliensis (ex Traore et al. 2017)]
MAKGNMKESAGRSSKTRLGYLSHDGTTQIRALVWEPSKRASAAPLGIVQIVHGMSEHVDRYDDFARFLVERGFVVCANDHVGHGESVPDPAKLGCLPAQGGKDVLVEDVHELRRTVAARYARQVPYVLFGHSMGSFVVRAYLARHAEGLAAAVVCGTGQQPLALSKAGNFLARRIAASKGEDYKSSFLDGLGAGAFAKQIENARTPFDWISVDPAVVDAYIADERCGVMFSAGGYATLTDLTGEVVTRSCAAKVPRDLPVLFVAGAEDPVGGCGKGVHAAAELLRGAGVRQVDEILYEGMRHEILNEPGRARVYTEVAQWIEEHACEKPTS